MDLQSLWQVLQPYLAGQLRHVLTFLAGYLVARGALATDQQGAFVSIAFTFAIWAIGALWSIWQKRDLPILQSRIAELEKRLNRSPLTGAAVQASMATKQ